MVVKDATAGACWKRAGDGSIGDGQAGNGDGFTGSNMKHATRVIGVDGQYVSAWP